MFNSEPLIFPYRLRDKDRTANPALKNIDCYVCWLRNQCLAKGLSQTTAKALESVIYSRKFSRGEHYYRLGDDFYSLYTVKSGTVKSYITDSDGTEQVLGFHFPGDILGMDALTQHKHTSSALALENSIVCALPYNRFEALCDLVPELHHAIELQLSNSIQQAQQVLLIINNKTAEERVAFFLLFVSFRMHTSGLSRSEFHLSMSRAEMGSFLRLAAETVTRILSKFEQRELIEVDSKNVRLKDFKRLSAYINSCSICSGFLALPDLP